MILYEFPLNETARTALRLEKLFVRFGLLLQRTDGLDHHHALMTLFEILEVCTRSDLKGDLFKEIERQKAYFLSLSDNPAVDKAALLCITESLTHVAADLTQLEGKIGASLQSNDWLMSIRGRSMIPGGCFEFDAPTYHAWLHRSTVVRQEDLQQWYSPFAAVSHCVGLLLDLMRQNGVAKRLVAVSGQFQQSLPQGRSIQLVRLALLAGSLFVPEFTGHRLMLSLRMLTPDAQGRYKPTQNDVDFEMALCS